MGKEIVFEISDMAACLVKFDPVVSSEGREEPAEKQRMSVGRAPGRACVIGLPCPLVLYAKRRSRAIRRPGQASRRIRCGNGDGCDHTACHRGAGRLAGRAGARRGGLSDDALADYVYGCMKVEWRNPRRARPCSCSIDVIASIIPYDHYARAETFSGCRSITGETAACFVKALRRRGRRSELKRAQAEADIRCF